VPLRQRQELHPVVGALVRYPIFVIFFIFYIAVAVVHPVFLSRGNLFDIFIETSMISFVAFGEAIAISVGAVDLSVGNIAGFGAMCTCYLMVEMGWPAWVAIVTGLAVGAAIGWGNGLLVSRLYINSMIATLGTMFMLVGLLYMITSGRSIMMLPDSFTNIGNGYFLGVPILIYLMVFAFIACHLFLEKTRFGRKVQMVGGGIEAARLSGVNIFNVTMGAFVLSGLLASASGIVLASRQGLANVDLGERFLLQAFTSAMLGTVIFGGRNIIAGTLCGALFLVSLVNGMTILGVGPQWIYFAQGSLLLAAILLNYYTKRITDRSKSRRLSPSQ
jgi:ribose/xylose/arabinose/galactoside ABC-type transport system permease subunit